ncbi:MAG TPA: hypothetical protein PLY30_00135 [Candidatus Omnitrophota bacterium]|nr:hypothetical protein [Candidatus Omnitrophota bacterium]
MDISRLLELLKRVLLTPEVIGVTIVMIVFFSLVNFVVYYRKRPPTPKPKKVEAAPVAAEGASKSGGKGAGRPSDEDEDEEEEEADAKKKKGGKRGKKADKGTKESAEEE